MQNDLSFTEPLFKMNHASRLAGAEARRLTVWYQRGIVDLGTRVSDRKRVFAIWEILQLALMARLAEIATIEKAIPWSAEAVKQLRAIWELRPRPLAEQLRACAGLGMVILELDHAEVRQGDMVRVTDAAHFFKGVTDGLASGRGSVAFHFQPIGLLLAGIVERATVLQQRQVTAA